jgi:hypothetical protein
MAAKAKQQTKTAIKAIKGFDADWKCRGYQYEIGKTFETNGSIVCCESGFHACDGSPFDVWAYYGPVGEDGRLNRFADVTMGGKISREDGGNDSKLASAKITIDAEITLPAFIKRAVAWVIGATKGKGDYAQIGSSGDYAQIGSSGHYARIGSSGDYAQIGSSGATHRSAPAATTHRSAPAATPHGSAAAATPHRSAPAATTHGSAPAATTHGSAPAATTHGSAPAATPHRSAPAATPHRSAPAATPHGSWPKARMRSSRVPAVPLSPQAQVARFASRTMTVSAPALPLATLAKTGSRLVSPTPSRTASWLRSKRGTPHR